MYEENGSEITKITSDVMKHLEENGINTNLGDHRIIFGITEKNFDRYERDEVVVGETAEDFKKYYL